jgi:hypothetical protein
MAHLRRRLVPVILPIVWAVAMPADAVACPFDLAGPKADRVFFALGMLFESPAPRGFGGANHVELFFCSEKDKVPLFTRVVTGLAREQGLPADLRVETKQGCLTILHSPPLAARLNACYTRGASSLPLTLFVRPGAQVVGDQPPAGKDLERRRALAYVAGVWARAGRDRAIVLTAGTAKADLVATLLKALGCANVRVERAVGYTPGSNTVRFEPTAEVSEWLGKTW